MKRDSRTDGLVDEQDAPRGLVDAIRRGDEPSVQHLLAAGARLDEPVPADAPSMVLHGLSSSGIVAVGWTPLHLACWEGLERTVRWLLDAGADANRAATFGWTPLHLACHRGHLRVVDHLLAHGSRVNARVDGGESVLEAAAYGGYAEIVSTLLAHGANPNDARPDGRSPLIAAAIGDHPRVVEILLAAGAAVDRSDQRGWTASMKAAWHHHSQVLQLLRNAGRSVSLHDAVARGDLPAIRAFLRRTPVDELHGNLTPLAWAALTGQVAIGQVLLEAGADLNRLAMKASAIELAAARGQTAFVQLLLEHGAEPRRALRRAAAGGHLEVVRWLLGHGVPASPDALVEAGRYGQAAAAELLLNTGLAPDATNEKWTALMCAATVGAMDVVTVAVGHQQGGSCGREPTVGRPG